MARPLRPTALFWGLFLALSGAALALHLRAPGHRTLPWLTAGVLVLLGLRVLTMLHEWRRERLPVLELKLAEPVRVVGLLGPGRPVDRLAVSLDDPSAFIAALGCPCA